MQGVPSELQSVEEVALPAGVRADQHIQVPQFYVARADAAEVAQADSLDRRRQQIAWIDFAHEPDASLSPLSLDRGQRFHPTGVV